MQGPPLDTLTDLLSELPKRAFRAYRDTDNEDVDWLVRVVLALVFLQGQAEKLSRKPPPMERGEAIEVQEKLNVLISFLQAAAQATKSSLARNRMRVGIQVALLTSDHPLSAEELVDKLREQHSLPPYLRDPTQAVINVASSSPPIQSTADSPPKFWVQK